MKKTRKLLLIEDGRVLAETVEDMEQRNPEIKIIVYQKGEEPILVEVEK